MAESRYIAQRRDRLSAKLNDLWEIGNSAQLLRERVRQMIEITDEDHGKAIRVFTIVTIIFLPM